MKPGTHNLGGEITSVFVSVSPQGVTFTSGPGGERTDLMLSIDQAKALRIVLNGD